MVDRNRDALWELIDERLPEVEIVRCDHAGLIADAILAAGWHPPDRVIETLEELEALPTESAVQVIGPAEDPEDPAAVVWVHALPGEWVETGSTDHHPVSEVNLPVWLRWSPPAEEGILRRREPTAARIAELEAALQTSREMYTSARERAAALRQSVGYVVARIQELDDDTEGPQLYGFSEDVLPTEFAARIRHSDAEGWRPGWRLYALTDITEEPTE